MAKDWNGTVEERFWRKVRITPSCWLWLASKDSGGYGAFTYNGKQERAHRVSYLLAKGEFPGQGLCLDHLCRVRSCVNPDHLEAVTFRENQRRGLAGVLKTHCPSGHTFDEANTYVTRGGHRQCRECHGERYRTNTALVEEIRQLRARIARLEAVG